MPGGIQQTEVTLPASALCHYITDDELERIGEMRKEPVMESCLASIGVFSGALIPALSELQKYSSHGKIEVLGLVTCFVAVGALTVGAVTGYLWKQRAETHRGMVGSIRSRDRVPVQ